MITYSSKVPTIINYTLAEANTWYKVCSAVPGVRQWMMKARENTDNSFDYDFTTTHATYATNSGMGYHWNNCDLPDVYCKSATKGTIIELIYWS